MTNIPQDHIRNPHVQRHLPVHGQKEIKKSKNEPGETNKPEKIPFKPGHSTPHTSSALTGKKVQVSIGEADKTAKAGKELSQKSTLKTPSLDPLNASIAEFREKTEQTILTPKRGVSDVDSDVYMPDGVGLVIKPGKDDARTSVMAEDVLKIVGLNQTVPAMKLGRLKRVQSAQDVDKEYVIKKDLHGKEFAIEARFLISLPSDKLPNEGQQIKDPSSDAYFTVKRLDKTKGEGHEDFEIEEVENSEVEFEEFDDEDVEEFEGVEEAVILVRSKKTTDTGTGSDKENEGDEGNIEDVENDFLKQFQQPLTYDEIFSPKLIKKDNAFESDFEDSEDEFSENESWIDEFQNTPFKLIQDANGENFYLAPQEAMHSVNEDVHGKKYVLRNEYPYSLNKRAKGGYEITGSDVPALYQEKITGLFVGEGEDGLDITKPSKARDNFYNKIDFQSFMESFVSYMLTRSQDGKIERLKKDSNFLFEEMENGKLRVRQIDLDSVMPLSNEPANDDKPHPLRCGLMGFPQVDQEILGADLRMLMEILGRCVTRKNLNSALRKIEMYGKKSTDTQSISEETQARMDAYKEVIEGIKSFMDQARLLKRTNKVTLKALFYHVFPSYAEHFELLVNPTDKSKSPLSPQLAALQVGAEPIARYKKK